LTCWTDGFAEAGAKRSRRVEASIIEWRCAAGEMGNPFSDASDPIPVAAKAEF
jgi:hypothetical protein